ncbi:hypothetical protein A0J47_019880 [Photobacterium damselae subsp. damselae]|uniref:Rossmann-like domain-containing protein n=1 Tax=Photobacterium damselae TaxID=38293 RepID=UPI00083B49EC|nr:DUF364 domain-containing protein [Photobacterium damselae]QSH58954.1 hypothetical protein A0J47_019880 [Photobacterium damselae subsp. damselae]
MQISQNSLTFCQDHYTLYVDTSSPEKTFCFTSAIKQLQQAGWELSSQDDLFTITATPLGYPVTIFTCSSLEFAINHHGITPDPFAIIQAIGGGQLEQALAASIPNSIVVDSVLFGFNWVFVKAGNLCGIARSPERGTEGARTIRPKEGFAGKTLAQLAQYFCSFDPLCRALGLAAINAYWNRIDNPYHFNHTGGFSAITPPGNGLVIIGGFRSVQQRLHSAKIIEREPRPGDIAVEDAPMAFQTAQQLAITAQTLMNGSLEPILCSSRNVPHHLLVGPSAPLCPILFDYGIDEISGLIMKNPTKVMQFIAESGAMIMLDDLVESRYLCAKTYNEKPNPPVN